MRRAALTALFLAACASGSAAQDAAPPGFTHTLPAPVMLATPMAKPDDDRAWLSGRWEKEAKDWAFWAAGSDLGTPAHYAFERAEERFRRHWKTGELKFVNFGVNPAMPYEHVCRILAMLRAAGVTRVQTGAVSPRFAGRELGLHPAPTDAPTACAPPRVPAADAPVEGKRVRVWIRRDARYFVADPAQTRASARETGAAEMVDLLRRLRNEFPQAKLLVVADRYTPWAYCWNVLFFAHQAGWRDTRLGCRAVPVPSPIPSPGEPGAPVRLEALAVRRTLIPADVEPSPFIVSWGERGAGRCVYEETAFGTATKEGVARALTHIAAEHAKQPWPIELRGGSSLPVARVAQILDGLAALDGVQLGWAPALDRSVRLNLAAPDADQLEPPRAVNGRAVTVPVGRRCEIWIRRGGACAFVPPRSADDTLLDDTALRAALWRAARTFPAAGAPGRSTITCIIRADREAPWHQLRRVVAWLEEEGVGAVELQVAR